MRWERCVSLPNLKLNLMGVGRSRTYITLQRSSNYGQMRCVLFWPCASASAATVHHSEPRHVIVRPSQGYAVPGWAYAAPRPPVHYGDTPSYDDPSKFGGGEALPVTH